MVPPSRRVDASMVAQGGSGPKPMRVLAVAPKART
jgi:hypothetical protein